MALKNQAITVAYTAWNASTNAPQTGDAANHAIKLIQDGTEASPTNAPTEVDSTNCPGTYKLALTAGDMDFNAVTLCGKSSTADVVIIPLTIITERGVLPAAAPASAGGLVTVGTGPGQLSPSAGGVDVQTIKTQAITCSAGVTVNPNVGTVHAWVYDANNYPGVNVADVGGAAAAMASTVPADIQTIKTQAVTCSASVAVGPNVGTAQPVNQTGTGSSATVNANAGVTFPSGFSGLTTSAIAQAVMSDVSDTVGADVAAILSKLTTAVDGGLDPLQAIYIVLALVAGVRSGVPASGSAGTVTVKDQSGTHNRASITLDTSGDITAANYTPPTV